MNDTQEQEQESDRQNPVQEAGFLKKIFHLLDFRKPGTKEDLEQGIQELLEEGEEHGLISPLEEKMINSILEFRETFASEIMTPAAEVVSYSETGPLPKLIELVIESGFTRIPVYRDNPDQVIGAIHAKDLLKLCARPGMMSGPLEEYLRSVYFIPESKPIGDLLREFQKRKVHMAMVTDEFGTVRGLITLEDILEEIVGEIDDEYDDEEDEHQVEVVDENTIQVHGWIDIEKVEDHFQIEFPDGPYESAGGLVIHLLGRLAVMGDVVELDNFRFQVKSASARQINRILICKIPEEE